jgi:hypothetical protein
MRRAKDNNSSKPHTHIRPLGMMTLDLGLKRHSRHKVLGTVT